MPSVVPSAKRQERCWLEWRQNQQQLTRIDGSAKRANKSQGRKCRQMHQAPSAVLAQMAPKSTIANQD